MGDVVRGDERFRPAQAVAQTVLPVPVAWVVRPAVRLLAVREQTPVVLADVPHGHRVGDRPVSAHHGHRAKRALLEFARLVPVGRVQRRRGDVRLPHQVEPKHGRHLGFAQCERVRTRRCVADERLRSVLHAHAIGTVRHGRVAEIRHCDQR